MVANCSLRKPSNLRKELWEQLTQIGNDMREPWVLIGDFNEIADPTEKKGGSKNNSQECRRFKERMDECKLMDLWFIGNKYTWKGAARDGLERVFKRLDKALSNLDWRITFSEARIKVLPRINSDHHHLLARTCPNRIDTGIKPFRYEAMWEAHPEFKNYVKASWKEM
ncbi:hypothetical protein S83_029770 [Arachis hypogaea]